MDAGAYNYVKEHIYLDLTLEYYRKWSMDTEASWWLLNDKSFITGMEYKPGYRGIAKIWDALELRSSRVMTMAYVRDRYEELGRER